MLILLDQNVSRTLRSFLEARRPSWTVRHVGDVELWGETDAQIFDWAQRNGALVVTFDEDFADARMYPAGTHHGVIRLRIWPTTIEDTEAALDRLLASVPDEDLSGSLVIVDNARIRVRRSIRHG